MEEEKYLTEEGEEVNEYGEVIPKKKKKSFFKSMGEKVKGSYGYGMIKEYKEKAPERREKRMTKMKESIEELKLQKQERKLREDKRKLKGSGGGFLSGVQLSGKSPGFAPSSMGMFGGGRMGGMKTKTPQIGGGIDLYKSPFDNIKKKKARRKKKR